MEKAEFISAVKSVFDACRYLSNVSEGVRLFTPDGRMVGDIGEVIAKFFYAVDLYSVGKHVWDGTYNGRNVQIKATGGRETYLKKPPEDGFGGGLLLVFQINRESGEYNLIYNGDIQRVWDELGVGADERIILLERLKRLQEFVEPDDVIPEISNLHK